MFIVFVSLPFRPAYYYHISLSFPPSPLLYLLHTFRGAYFHYGSKEFEAPKCVDISPNPGRSDPMYIVQAAKKMEKAAA